MLVPDDVVLTVETRQDAKLSRFCAAFPDPGATALRWLLDEPQDYGLEESDQLERKASLVTEQVMVEVR